MSGLLGLVPLAELLAELSGANATDLASAILVEGLNALPRRSSDTANVVRQLLHLTGVVATDGVLNRARAAELVLVCEVLAVAAPTPPGARDDPRLVLSAPTGAADIEDVERLDGLVLDVMRQATTSIHLGGAFWNGDGFALLNDVLLPAISLRQTATTLYVNPPEERVHRETLAEQISTLQAQGPVTVLWFTGPRPTMLHAKFVIANGCRGYLGTANLTSWGLHGGHVEAGVELTSAQCTRFIRFLDQLHASGLFAERPPL